MDRVRPWAIFFVMAVTAAGSGQRVSAALSPAAGASSDSVRIVSISPGTDAPLRVGDRISFKVEVEYTLVSAASGSITLVIQQGESDRAPLANETQVIQKGAAKLVLTKDIEVPDTKAVQVFTPLTVQGGTSTSVVDTRAYRVVKR